MIAVPLPALWLQLSFLVPRAYNPV